MSLNVRGSNDSNKWKVVKALLNSQRVDLVCLLETKMKEMSQTVVHSLCVGKFLE